MVLKLQQEGDWAVFLPNNAAFNKTVRFAIKPISYRKFENGQVYVHKQKIPQLINLAKRHFAEVDTSMIPNGWLTGEKTSSLHHVLYLTPDAPDCVVRASYAALVLALHPDQNDGQGDPEKLQEVILAYRSITKT